MGGSAFTKSHPHISIIRLTPPQYSHICALIPTFLPDFYKQIPIPPATPEKPSHNDIDILVHTPLRAHMPTEDISRALGATAHITSGGEKHFAIPMSKFLADSEQVALSPAPSAEESSNESPTGYPHFQLNIHVSSADHFRRALTFHSYGDTWMIFGATVNRYGFVLSTSGLSVQLQGFEGANVAKKTVLLSTDPDAIMQFLGLDAARFQRGFETLDEVFKCIVACRFFRRRFFIANEREEPQLDPSSSAEKKPTSNNKQQRKSHWNRWMANKFINRWLPAYPEPAHESTSHPTLTAESSLKDALNQFNKHTEYDQTLTTHLEEATEADLWKKIARTLEFLKGKDLGTAMKHLKRILASELDDEGLERRVRETPGLVVEGSSPRIVVGCIVQYLREIRGVRYASNS